ncbi:hypothetical protein [Candidatus Erwinia dacicola]|uniref:hypothetical protein n=1 Tax=Candidatus Erwinia dacicola TaxID=252393 RepID=UPI0009F34953|nr:hypothetical protein [Candidatus Erwinia dacicola]
MEAPIKLHEQVGTIQLVEGDEQLASYPLVALKSIEEAALSRAFQTTLSVSCKADFPWSHLCGYVIEKLIKSLAR